MINAIVHKLKSIKRNRRKRKNLIATQPLRALFENSMNEGQKMLRKYRTSRIKSICKAFFLLTVTLPQVRDRTQKENKNINKVFVCVNSQSHTFYIC